MAHTKNPSDGGRDQKERRRSRDGAGKRSKSSKTMCAIFNFRTLALDSAYLSERAIARQSAKSTDQVVTNKAVQDYTNGTSTKPTTKITTILAFSRSTMSRLVTARVPTCGGREALYLQKVRDRETSEFYIELLEKRPKFANKIKVIKRKAGQKDLVNHYRFRWPSLGMTVVMLFSVFPEPRKPIVNEVVFHPHGVPVNDMVQRERESAEQTLGSPTGKKCEMPRAKHCEFVNEYSADPKSAMKRHRFMNKDTFLTMKEWKERKKSMANGGKKTSRRKKNRNSSTVSEQEGSRTVPRRNGDGKKPKTSRTGRKSRREQKWTGAPIQKAQRSAAEGAEGTKRRRSRPRKVQQRVCGDNLDDESTTSGARGSYTQTKGVELALDALEMVHSRSVSMSSASSSSPSASPSLLFHGSLRAPLTPLVDVAEP